MAGTSSQEASNMGQIRQREKKRKTTRGTRFSKIMKTTPQPIPVPRRNVERVESPRRRVQLALAKFNEIRISTHKHPATILKDMQESDPHLLGTIGELGQVPGVDVGDRFNSRAELKLVGLHGELVAGIHWKDVEELNWRDVQFRKTGGNFEGIATSVVVSGEYEDTVDHGGETIIYTGEGGKAGAKHQTHNQKLMGGNEALRNNCIRRCPVRVIRGRWDPDEPKKKFYSYDGLFKVTQEKPEKGKSGFLVYQFTLTREDGGQGPLAR